MSAHTARADIDVWTSHGPGVVPVATHHGTEIKTTGDGLMLCFASAARAVACGVALQQAADRQGRQARRPATTNSPSPSSGSVIVGPGVPACPPVQIRVGISAGEAGKWFSRRIVGCGERHAGGLVRGSCRGARVVRLRSERQPHPSSRRRTKNSAIAWWRAGLSEFQRQHPDSATPMSTFGSNANLLRIACRTLYFRSRKRPCHKW